MFFGSPMRVLLLQPIFWTKVVFRFMGEITQCALRIMDEMECPPVIKGQLFSLNPQEYHDPAPTQTILTIRKIVYRLVKSHGLPCFKHLIEDGQKCGEKNIDSVRLSLNLNKWWFKLQLGDPLEDIVELIRNVDQKKENPQIGPEELIETFYPIYGMKEIYEFVRKKTSSLSARFMTGSFFNQFKYFGGFDSFGREFKKKVVDEDFIDQVMRIVNEDRFVHIEELRSVQNSPYYLMNSKAYWDMIYSVSHLRVDFPFIHDEWLDVIPSQPIFIWIPVDQYQLDDLSNEVFICEGDVFVGNDGDPLCDRKQLHQYRKVVIDPVGSALDIRRKGSKYLIKCKRSIYLKYAQ